MNLAPLPALPKSARKARPTQPCECGCGTPTSARFAPGHDSRLRGWILRVERGVVKLAEIPNGERQAVKAAMDAGMKGSTSKTVTVVVKAKTNKERKAARRAAKALAAPIVAAEPVPPVVVEQPAV